MAFQSVPNTASVEVLYSLNGEPSENTFYFERSAPYDQSDIDQLAIDMLDWAQTDWMPNLTQDITLMQVIATGLELVNDFQGIALDGVTVGGTASQALPSNVSFSIKRYSGLTGRSARGRIYVAGLALNALTANENVLGAGIITNLQTDLNNIMSFITDPLWTQVIVSRFASGVQRLIGVTFPVLGYVAVTNRVATRKDRLP